MRCTACALLLTLLALAGCSTCASPHDRAYAAYGGVWERTDECEGRVGSAFTPAGIRISDEATDDGQEATGYGLETSGYRLQATEDDSRQVDFEGVDDSPPATEDRLQVMEY